METWLAVIMAMIILIYALCRVRIIINLEYRRRGRDDVVAVDVSLLNRLIAYKLQVPVIKWTDKGLPWFHTKVKTIKTGAEPAAHAGEDPGGNILAGDFHEPDEWRYIVQDIRFFGKMYKSFIRRIESRLICEKFFWRTRLGADDPAVTSMLIGLLWTVKSIFVVKLKKRVRVDTEPMIIILPVYTGVCCDVELECIFSIRLGNVINATLAVINFVLEGGTRQWANTQSKG